MIAAAYYYYEDNLTHAEIADKLGMSRVAVTRLLQQARRTGLVEIRITKPLPQQDRLQRELVRTFGLRSAVTVVTRPMPEATLDEIGRAGARFLLDHVMPGCRIGISWSQTVSRMTRHLTPPPQPVSGTINELAGSYWGHLSPFNVSAEVARILGMPQEPLPAPVVVQSAAARELFLAEPAVRTALANAEQCDLAFFGVGTLNHDNVTVRLGHVTPKQLDKLVAAGAVGELLLRFFDADGHHMPSPVEDNVVTLGWEQIRQLPHVVVMASGLDKVAALRGVLRGGIVQTLITDTTTAEALLDG